jgi:hypothetical protein
MRNFYHWERQLTPKEIAEELSMRVARTWSQGGLTMSLLVKDRSGTHKEVVLY